MHTLILQGENSGLGDGWIDQLVAAYGFQSRLVSAGDFYAGRTPTVAARHVYLASLSGPDGMTPDLTEAQRVLRSLATANAAKVVILSSALVYGTGPARQAMVSEEYPVPRKGGAISEAWRSLEELAARYLPPPLKLTVLRAVTVVPSRALLSRLLTRRLVPTLAGFDPILQLLSPGDLAQAIRRALDGDRTGIFNVAPDTVVPLRKAIRIGGGHRVPFPRTLARLARSAAALDYLRYPWTVSSQKIKDELGFAPEKTSVAALLQARGRSAHRQVPDLSFDEFGMDANYIQAYGKTLFRFLSDYYWRIEEKGLEHIPRQGRAVLVGMHRGFMPWDGVMALHLLARKTGRYPRFLIHPGLLIFPCMANFMTKLGGVVACHASANRLLAKDELLGVFPEGIQGAFTPYREAYKLQRFGREAFVKMALANRAPIIPFVTVGSAEIFPILGKIESRLWSRYTEWPYIPLTPTFPLLPVPLPSKWHTLFLPPIHVEQMYPPEAATDRAVVKSISLEVRARMQEAVDEMLRRRRSVFRGSVFEPEGHS